MKRILSSILLLSSICNSFAQIDVPQQSPKVMLKHTVGVTDVTIEYNSPAVKGRTIWGELVPLGELWRTGANKVSTIEFSKEVAINGKDIKAGKYSLLTIPGEKEWEIIINENSEMWGVNSYDLTRDVVRLKAPVVNIPHAERFAITITDYTDKVAKINLAWEKVSVAFEVDMKTDKHAIDNINANLGGTWRNYLAAARYMLDFNRDLNDALTWINTSIQLKEDWFNYWIKAQILSKMNNNKEALIAARKSKELGDKATNFFYKDAVEKAIQEWEKKK